MPRERETEDLPPDEYQGAYGSRALELGDLSELDRTARESPWADDRMEKVFEKLYDGCARRATEYDELYEEVQRLRASSVGRSSPKLKRQIETVEQQRAENREWFEAFDRRVYLLHVQMANRVDKKLREELVERYRFHLELQRFYQKVRAAFAKSDAFLVAHGKNEREEIDLGSEFVDEVVRVLRDSWKSLKGVIKDARATDLPAMKYFEECADLANYVLEDKLVAEPPPDYTKGWVNKFMTQLQGARQKCSKLQIKSVSGILRLQEQIVTRWKLAREPIPAEVIDAEPIEAEVIEAEVIDAEVIDAEVVDAEVVDAEVVETKFILPPEPPPEPPKTEPAPVDVVGHANMFDFDALAPGTPVPSADVFALNPDPFVSAPTAQMPALGAITEVAPPVGGEREPPVNQTAWLDPVKLKAEKAKADALRAEAEERIRANSAPPADKGAFGSGAPVVFDAKAFKAMRPAVRITLVKPGEESPLAK
ncbi:Uncharacterized protein OS=Plasmodium yoelii 17X GN=YYC_00901 PE=4 SV=1 [Gemmata massiliana]|uniref:Uncharacterized protein n=1 Tax=Gemmata massiliana TaxID=1210884 RepID=A0A6P2D3I7_9BACT|nr:hypothetical protein [Gemmata massiliana]VTR95653.1 Uncharacterized protein OS=Plasmodium yoelii 17X GN=YYC_00901 PE=4 SV=1 [Gemmata massiliana]